MDVVIAIIGIIFFVVKQAAKQKTREQSSAKKWHPPVSVVLPPKAERIAAPVASMEGVDPCHDEGAFISMEGIDPCHDDMRFEPQITYEETSAEPAFPVFTKNTLLQGVIMAEVLSRPMKRMGRRGA